MTRVQTLILIGLGMAILAACTGAAFLLSRPETQELAPTIPLATVPPSSLLLTRVPICREVVELALADQGWASVVTLDAQKATLEIQLDAPPAGSEDELPAGQIWGAFEAALAGRANGCSGYTDLVVLVGDFRAHVALDDLLAWESGAIDEGTFSDRVDLTR